MLADAIGRLPDGAGPIGLLSGDEFTPGVAAFDRALLAASGLRVALITAADPANAARIVTLARDHFATLGAGVTPVATPLADLPDFDVLYLAGGDPRVLLTALGDDPGWAEVERRWRAGAALAGASAGAMALCEHCLVPAPGADKPTMWARGLGPLRDIGLAVHATTRPAEWLQQVAASSRSPVLAIDDVTGVLIARADEPVVIGRGGAWIVARTAKNP